MVRKIAQRVFKHGGEGLAEMAAWLMATRGAAEESQIQVAIEVPHGPVVETLIERAAKVHAINPKQMDRFRNRYTLAAPRTTEPRVTRDELGPPRVVLPFAKEIRFTVIFAPPSRCSVAPGGGMGEA